MAAAATSTPEITATPEPTPTPTPLPTQTPTPVPTITPEPISSTMWGANFPDKFTDGEVIQDENSYKSAHVNVAVQKVQKDGVTYYLADIYIADLKYFMTAFADGKYQGDREYVYKVAQKKNAIIAINGDYYKVNAGPVFKNGEFYRDEKYKDVLVMFKDGTMQTFTKDKFDMNALKGNAWQIFTWGPMLLKDGEPMTKFNLPASIGGANPRTAIGYYEPGHYVFLTVDGRSKDSKGMSMTELSQFFHDLGCKVAFNLDGGGSAQMAFMGNEINQPCSTYRKDCDILYIADEKEQ